MFLRFKDINADPATAVVGSTMISLNQYLHKPGSAMIPLNQFTYPNNSDHCNNFSSPDTEFQITNQFLISHLETVLRHRDTKSNNIGFEGENL